MDSSPCTMPSQTIGELKVKPEFLVIPTVKDQIVETKESDTTAAENGNKKQKSRGRNKDRPPPIRFSYAQRLCPVLVDVSPERETYPECKYPNCSFQHDVLKYLESKPSDLGPECFVFKQYGRCNRGVTCCFAESHIIKGESNQVRNLVNKDLSEKFGTLKIRELNHLDKDLQIQLRKKSYKFDDSDKKVDSLFKLRDSERANSNPPPAKKFKNDSEEVVENVQSKVEESGPTQDEQKADQNNIEPEQQVGEPQFELDESNPKYFNDEKPGFKKIDWSNKLYLAPLTTVGNLPFRRICKEFGVDITCGEMAMSIQLLQAHPPEWALVQRHQSEDIFGIQLCGNSPQQLTRVAQLVEDGHIHCDFVDLNLGCPIDLVYKRGMGSGLMDRKKPLEVMVRAMSSIMTRPLTLKMRTGIHMDKRLAHGLVPLLKDWGIDMITIHGRSREQRYTKLADWEYIAQCADIARPIPTFGNGDIINYEDYNRLKEAAKVDGIMIARGALIKPWIFTEIKDQRHWDISAQERLDMIRRYANYGMEHWGSDSKGVETTRRFLLEWLSFLHRYVPCGILEKPPQRMNERVPNYKGRSDLETLLSSPACTDWIKITEMFLGKIPENFAFMPKHKAHGY